VTVVANSGQFVKGSAGPFNRPHRAQPVRERKRRGLLASIGRRPIRDGKRNKGMERRIPLCRANGPPLDTGQFVTEAQGQQPEGSIRVRVGCRPTVTAHKHVPWPCAPCSLLRLSLRHLAAFKLVRRLPMEGGQRENQAAAASVRIGLEQGRYIARLRVHRPSIRPRLRADLSWRLLLASHAARCRWPHRVR
jgi:hypothetical protein